MIKYITCFIWFLGLICSAQITEQDFLSANGRVICNELGDTVVLKGTNLGAWLSFEHWMGPSGYGAIDREKWEITAQYTKVGSSTANMIDGDLASYWRSGITQYTNNQWVIVDMGQDEVFSRIDFKTRENSTDYPRTFDIYKSIDASQWTKLGTYYSSNGDIKAYIELTSCRYIKIVQTEKTIENWSISELNICMNDDIHVRRSLINRFGEEEADQLMDYYCSMWITENDLDVIQNMGMNVVRVPIFWMEIMREDGTIKSNAFRHIDWLVNECTARDIYIILDLHCSPGGNDGYFTSGMAVTNELWTSSYYQNLTVKLWEALAAHYKGNPTIACYDLLNESWSNSDVMSVDNFYDVLYKAVRAIDPDHTICVQAFPSFDYVSSPQSHGWTNVMYQAHYYNTDYHNETSQDGFAEYAISDLVRHQHDWDVPVFAGEFAFWEHLEVWEKFFSGLNASNISWTNWSYKCRESISSRDNFSYYTDNNNEDPDLIYDDVATIKAKWDKFGSEYFMDNTVLKNLVTKAIAKKADVPRNKEVYIQQYDGRYLVLLDNDQLSFSTLNIELASPFIIQSTDDNQIAIRASNQKFLSTEGGSSEMTSSRENYDGWERFTWIDLGNNEFGLYGNSGFVSGEGGGTGITCNRTSLSGWERFSWIESVVNGISVPTILKPLLIANRTVKNTDDLKRKVSIYTFNGMLVSQLTLEAKASTTLSLASGCYILRSTHNQLSDAQKIIIQ